MVSDLLLAQLEITYYGILCLREAMLAVYTINPKIIDFCGPKPPPLCKAGTSIATGPPKILAIHGQ
jgi:hypothetical protein